MTWIVLVFLHLIASLAIIGGVATSEIVDSLLAMEFQDSSELTLSHACCMPILGSLGLLMFFYYFAQIQSYIIVYFMLISYVADMILLWFGLQKCTCLRPTMVAIVSTLLASLVIILWIGTNHWLIIDILSFSLSILLISTLRLKSLKVGLAAGVGLLVYDVFWVYFSELFFKENVMVKAASQVASNPAPTIAKAVAEHITGAATTPQNLDLPMKLVLPSSEGSMVMLGTGDIVMPGLLISLAARVDMYLLEKCSACANQHSEELMPSDVNGGSRCRTNSTLQASSDCCAGFGALVKQYPYLLVTLLGYNFGLASSYSALALFSAAQPALLYIVPLCLVPLVLVSWRRGHLAIAWGGIPKCLSEDEVDPNSVTPSYSPQLIGRALGSALGRKRIPQPRSHRQTGAVMDDNWDSIQLEQGYQ